MDNLEAIYKMLKIIEQLSMETPIDSKNDIDVKKIRAAVPEVELLRFKRLFWMLVQEDFLGDGFFITLKGLEYLHGNSLMTRYNASS